MQTMLGWQCPRFIVDGQPSACALSEWPVKISERSARTRDILEEELSERDFIDTSSVCPYSVDQYVMLLMIRRHQKRLPPFEPGWVV